jgi:hypothetical protein
MISTTAMHMLCVVCNAAIVHLGPGRSPLQSSAVQPWLAAVPRSRQYSELVAAPSALLPPNTSTLFPAKHADALDLVGLLPADAGAHKLWSRCVLGQQLVLLLLLCWPWPRSPGHSADTDHCCMFDELKGTIRKSLGYAGVPEVFSGAARGKPVDKRLPRLSSATTSSKQCLLLTVNQYTAWEACRLLHQAKNLSVTEPQR